MQTTTTEQTTTTTTDNGHALGDPEAELLLRKLERLFPWAF